MGFFDSLNAYLKGVTPAMEAGADDITKDIDHQMKSTLGASSVSQDNQKEDTQTDDPSKTDDIFGTKGDNDGGNNDDGEDTNDDESGGIGDIEENPDDAGEDMPGDGDDSGDGSGDDGSDSDDYSPEDIDNAAPVDPTEIEKLSNLRDNMILLYETIDNNIKLLSDNVPEVIIPEQSDVIGKVIENLTECKNLLYKEITESFGKKTYADLMFVYTAIQRAYDLSTLMLEKHLDNIHDVAFAAKKKRTSSRKSKSNGAEVNPSNRFLNPSMSKTVNGGEY